VALQRTQALDYDTILPGHGSPGGPELYGAMQQYLDTARDSLSKSSGGAELKSRLIAEIMLFTRAEGEVNELHIGLKGTMNALFLKDLAIKTHRGIEGRVRHGKSGGGRAYGYRVANQRAEDGNVIRGDREIVEVEAAIVRRIFAEFATGKSPRAIGRGLNRENIKGPN